MLTDLRLLPAALAAWLVAGVGVGVPVWVALPFIPDWRWLLDRSDSPWYPTARLFHQTTFGDWDEVMLRVRAALEQWAG